ncbi:MAG: Nudix family hydrolase [Betaproteobacteria bacterium]
MNAPQVRVAAAVLLQPDGRVLLAQRPPGKAYAGYWEFPGGKLETGETPHAALVRELREELGIIVRRAAPWLVQEFVYPHAHVQLHFFRVFEWDGELFGHDGQAFAWQTPGAWNVAPLLPANTRILSALALPPVYAITNAAQIGEEALVARARAAFATGLRLLQVRDKEWPLARRLALASRLVPLADVVGARIMFNGSASEAHAAGCAGVHLSAAALMQATVRPPDLLVAASCHTASELAYAGLLDLDFAVLGPVAPTLSHPDAAGLGWQPFAAMAVDTHLPVYALGGLARGDAPVAIAHGAQGVAIMRSAWTDAV